MSKLIKKHVKITVLVILFSIIILPNSAYASSTASISNHTSSYATSFFSSVTGAIASFFEKDKNNYTDPINHNGSNTGGNNWLGWLKGKDTWGGWWDCKGNDSYSLWDKYYRY